MNKKLIEIDNKTYINQGYKIYNQEKFCNFIWNYFNPNNKIIKGDGYDIHHIDKNKLNDNINNLIKILHGEHSSLHNKGNNHPFYGKSFSEETKRKLSNSHKGKHHSEKTKKKISESQIGEKNHNFGKHPSEKTLKKMSEATKGKNNPMFGIHIFGNKHSEETKKKMSESGKIAWIKRHKEVTI